MSNLVWIIILYVLFLVLNTISVYLANRISKADEEKPESPITELRTYVASIIVTIIAILFIIFPSCFGVIIMVVLDAWYMGSCVGSFYRLSRVKRSQSEHDENE